SQTPPGGGPGGPPRAGAPEVDRRLFERAAARHGLDARLVEAVARVESGLDPRAVSPAGAVGLMQLMPETARAMGARDPLDPEQNVEAGARYLRELLDRFGDLSLALAAYNAGPEAVERHGGLPPYPETQAFVRRVLDQLG
ncbi:MAG: lytic transglycosylase domain-containing protein, partial [Clostridia bacterium]|nr:lytic transglycosylase domain-containing protein [Clostridia bacterium]